MSITCIEQSYSTHFYTQDIIMIITLIKRSNVITISVGFMSRCVGVSK